MCGFDTLELTELSRRIRFGATRTIRDIYGLRWQSDEGIAPVQHVLDHNDSVVKWLRYFNDERPADLRPYKAWRRFIGIAERYGWDAHRLDCFSDPWDADHIQEVHEGGGGCGLDNYQTLCQPCHKKKTARKRALAAAARRTPQNESGQLEMF